MAYKTERTPYGSVTVDRGPFGFNIGTPAGAQAAGQGLAGAFQAAGQFGNAAAGAYGAYGQGYGAYASALANLANAEANSAANRYAAYGTAESARQGTLGQLGSAALAAYGNAANSAQNAWGANQTAYAKALSDMAGANQYATSQYGVGRDTALANLGQSYSSLGTGLANARASLGNSYSNLAGAGSQAYGNLGGALANAGSTLGSSANQGLASLRGQAANSLGYLGGSGNTALGNVGAAASNAYGTVGGAAAQSLGNVGGLSAAASGRLGESANTAYGQLGTAFGNAMGGVNQAALTGMSNLGVAGQGTLGTLGQAGAGMAGQFGNAAANVAQTAANYTRDIGKLGLARELGLGNMNVASQGMATAPWTAGAVGNIFGGGGGGGGGISISGPDGTIAGGDYGGSGVAGGVGAGAAASGGGYAGGAPAPIYIDPYANPAWYQAGPQYYDGGGMQSLSGLSNAGFGYLNNTGRAANDAVGSGMRRLGRTASQAGRDLSNLNARNSADVTLGTSANQRALSQAANDAYGSVLSGLGRSNDFIDGTASRLSNDITGATMAGYGAIGRQASAGAQDIADATRAGYGYLNQAGTAAYGGIGQSLASGFGGLRDQGQAMDRTEASAFGGLGSLRDSINNSPALGAMNTNYQSALAALANANDSGAPGRMLRDAYSGLRSLNAMNLDASGAGMNQFYGNAAAVPTAPFDAYRNMVGSGFGQLGRELNRTQTMLGDLYDPIGQAIRPDPLRDAQESRAVELYNRRNDLRDQIARWAGSSFPGMAEGYRRQLSVVPTE